MRTYTTDEPGTFSKMRSILSFQSIVKWIASSTAWTCNDNTYDSLVKNFFHEISLLQGVLMSREPCEMNNFHFKITSCLFVFSWVFEKLCRFSLFCHYLLGQLHHRWVEEVPAQRLKKKNRHLFGRRRFPSMRPMRGAGDEPH